MEKENMYARECKNLLLPKNKTERRFWTMKKIVITIIMFAIAIGMIIGIIVPIATHGRETGQTAKTRMTTIDGDVSTLMQPIN
jgi:hypothetical protein